MTIGAVPAPSKTCSKCKTDKPLTEYHKDPRHSMGVKSQCKQCKKGPLYDREKQRNRDYKRRYGITAEEYDSMFEAQGGTCFVCHKPQEGKRLAIDHCHGTGKVRSLLCENCNRALGLLQEDSTTILSLLNYVELHKSC